jgi:hypothetical protein
MKSVASFRDKRIRPLVANHRINHHATKNPARYERPYHLMVKESVIRIASGSSEWM